VFVCIPLNQLVADTQPVLGNKMINQPRSSVVGLRHNLERRRTVNRFVCGHQSRSFVRSFISLYWD